MDGGLDWSNATFRSIGLRMSAGCGCLVSIFGGKLILVLVDAADEAVLGAQREIGRKNDVRSGFKGALGKLRRAKIAEHDVMVAKEAVVQILERSVGPIRNSFDLCTCVMDDCSGILKDITEHVKDCLYSIADYMHSSGQDDFSMAGFRDLPGAPIPAPTSPELPATHIPAPSLRARLDLFNAYLVEQSSADLESDVLLSAVVDNETYALYEEAEKIARAAELTRSKTHHGQSFLVHAWDHCIMHLGEVSDAYENLLEVFNSHESSTHKKSPSALSQIFLNLGLKVQQNEAQAMILQTGSSAATLDDLLVRSDTFRKMLLSADGTCFGKSFFIWKYVSRCHAVSCLPLWWLQQHMPEFQTVSYAKEDRILEAGRRTEYLYIIERGEVMLRTQAGKVIAKLKEFDVFGELELFCGTPCKLSATAASDCVTVYRVCKSVLATALEGGRYIANVTEALIGCVDLATLTGFGEVVEGFTIPEGMSSENYRGAFMGAVAGCFCPHLHLEPSSMRKEINLIKDVLPGLTVVSNCWSAFSDSEQTADLKDVIDLRGKTGEVGAAFTENFSAAVYTALEAQIRSDEVDLGEEDSVVEDHVQMLRRMFGFDDAFKDAPDPDVFFRITEDNWWKSWLLVVQDDTYARASMRTETAPTLTGTISVEEDVLEVNALQKVWSYLSRSRIKSALLSANVLDRYEAAYVLTVGNLTEPMPLALVEPYLAVLLPSNKGFTSVNVIEFLDLFGKDGNESQEVIWSSIRKVIRERARELASGSKAEPIFVKDSAYVFNSLSVPIDLWRRLIRLISIYHFLVVPLRITFSPFQSATDPWLLCTDLVADILTFFHIVVSLNTAYLNKRSKWVYSRGKILKHYCGTRAFILVLLIVVPLDWISLGLGVEMQSADWLRIPKMFFVKLTGRHATASGLSSLATSAALELHLSATMWAFLGLVKTSDDNPFTLGKTWLSAPAAEKHLSGLSMDGSGELTSWELYSQAMNWASTHTVSTVGNATLAPKNYLEIIFAILLMTLSMTFYKMFLGRLSAQIMQNDQNIIRVRGDLSTLEAYVTKNRLDEDKKLVEEIHKNFEVKNDPNNIDSSEIFDNMSTSLRLELATILVGDILEHIELFRGCSPPVLDGLAAQLRETSYDPEQIIFDIGGLADELFIVTFGTIEVLEESDEAGGGLSLSKVMKKGHAVGEVSFAFGMKHIYTARAGAGTGASCWKLGRKAYLDILKLFPYDHDLVTSNSLRSFELAKDMIGQSRKSKSLRGPEVVQEADKPMPDPEEMSLESFELGSDLTRGSGLDVMIGSRISAQIETLKAHQKNAETQKLLNAAHAGDLDKIIFLQTRAVNINSSDSSGRTALHLAASEGHLEVVKHLLGMMANPSVRDIYENTPLNDAVRHRHDDVAAFIRSKVPGAKVLRANLLIRKALSISPSNLVFRGSAFSFSLSFCFAQVMLPGCMGAVKLLTFAHQGDLDAVKRLLDNGVEVTTPPCFSPYVFMDMDVKSPSAPLVIPSEQVNSQDYDKRSALHLAACEGHVEVVKHLLAAKANPTLRDRFGGTALHDSVRHRQTSVHQYLKEAGSQLTGMDTAIVLCKCAASGDT